MVEKLDYILNTINDYIGVSEAEKKNLGEVFTPFKLVNNMVNTLPIEVWSNPKLRFLDPANGIGNYQIVLVQRLMEGLKEFEPDEELRYKHIMENMIYVVELNVKNQWIYLNLFDRENKYKLNYFRGSFLTKEYDELGWGKFDVIVGNPPYQEKVGEKKTQQLWGKFIVKSYSILNDNKYLNFVHPGVWRFLAPKSLKDIRMVNNIYTTNKLLSAKLHNYSQGKIIFGVDIDYDTICLKKEKSNGDCILTTNKDGEYKINIKDRDIIPTDNISLYERLKAKEGESKINLIFSTSAYHARKSSISKIKDNRFKYPVIYGYPVKGLKLIYSEHTTSGHFNIPKLILTRASLYSLLDEKGEYGMSEYAAGIDDSIDNLKEIKKVIDSDFFKQLKGFFLGVVSQNRNAAIDAPGNMYKFIREFKKDFWKEFTEDELSFKFEDSKISKSVGANIAQSSYDRRNNKG